MVFRSLLLVLACLQSFISAEHHNEPEKCCYSYQKSRIPVKLITAYEEPDFRCALRGVIFTLKNGKEVCANPEDEWVKKHKNTIDQRKFKNLS
ncbi:C-C motif chemokine 4 homolog [Neoarius graeffei]|uniref:C-C motif chemokine 4 homolog n=1 Tax=Neoarius graeffei TaxID=443677 RepID=UPI00298C1EB5|nr:C-C motif chemokine 4 homolog [Neoarius graeffei]XP_060771887.1 C-C motif chemokine 4 homolog [Neoarius graeffei]